jgi:hypothetical protein
MEKQNELRQTSSESPATAAIDLADAHILSRLGGRVRDLEVLFQEQGLVLRGHAGTYYAKQLAQHAAMEVTGLPVLANEIEVQ